MTQNSDATPGGLTDIMCRYCGRDLALHEEDGSCPPEWEEG